MYHKKCFATYIKICFIRNRLRKVQSSYYIFDKVGQFLRIKEIYNVYFEQTSPTTRKVKGNTKKNIIG